MNTSLKALLSGTALVWSASALAMTYFLTEQWVDRGQRFCKYGNGTVLNVGVNVCPTSIKG